MWGGAGAGGGGKNKDKRNKEASCTLFVRFWSRQQFEILNRMQTFVLQLSTDSCEIRQIAKQEECDGDGMAAFKTKFKKVHSGTLQARHVYLKNQFPFYFV